MRRTGMIAWINRWTEDELTEALIHLSGYVGVPLIREAMVTASGVFAELREEGFK